MELISQSEWARRKGFTRQYANKLVKNGTIQTHDGKIDPDQAERALDSLRNPMHDSRRNSNGSADGSSDDLPTILLKTRIKNEIEKGKLLHARAQAEIGELVNANAVKEAAFNMARVVRDGMLNIPDRLASVLAACDDEKKVHEIMTKEIRVVLEELSKDDE